MKFPRIAIVFVGLSALSVTSHSVAMEDKPETAHDGWVKRRVDKFLSDHDTGTGRGVHLGPLAPRLTILSSGSGPAPILHFWAPDVGGSPIDIHASAAYSLYKYQYYDLRVGLLPQDGTRIPRLERGTNAWFPLTDLEKMANGTGSAAYLSARFRDYPREDFSGIGPGTLETDRTDFRFKDALYEGVVRYRVGHLSLMGRGGLLKTSILSGKDTKFPNTESTFNDRTAPGLSNAPDFVHLSAGAWLERRDQPSNPHQGIAVGLAFSRFNDRSGNAFQWNRAALDAREYISLGSKRHVVALRQAVSLDKPDAGSRVPFYMQSTLGGSSLLRGYSSSRFHDEKLLYLSGEYRFELRPRVELALIYDTGKVFPTSADFNLKDLRHSYGAGVRLKSPRKVHFRCDFMRSPEGMRVHLKLEPSF